MDAYNSVFCPFCGEKFIWAQGANLKFKLPLGHWDTVKICHSCMANELMTGTIEKASQKNEIDEKVKKLLDF